MPPNLTVVAQQKPFPAPLKEHAADMVEQARQAEPLRIMLPKLERLCRPSSNRFWVIGGEPGAFKTKLAWNIALNLAVLRKRVLFVSLEMHPARLVLMFAARHSGLEERRIVHAFEQGGRPFDSREQSLFDSAMAAWGRLGESLWIHSGERDGWALGDVLHNARRVAWDAVILDHGRLLCQDDWQKAPATVEALRRLSYGKARKPFVMAVWPLNGEGLKHDDDGEPRMPNGSHLWGGPCVQYGADTVVVLQKRAKLDDEAAVVPVDAFVTKNREGPAPVCVALNGNGRTSMVTERGGDEPPPPEHWTQREPGDDE